MSAFIPLMIALRAKTPLPYFKLPELCEIFLSEMSMEANVGMTGIQILLHHLLQETTPVIMSKRSTPEGLFHNFTVFLASPYLNVTALGSGTFECSERMLKHMLKPDT